MFLFRWRKGAGGHQSFSVVFETAGDKHQRRTQETTDFHGHSSSTRSLSSSEAGKPFCARLHASISGLILSAESIFGWVTDNVIFLSDWQQDLDLPHFSESRHPESGTDTMPKRELVDVSNGQLQSDLQGTFVSLGIISINCSLDRSWFELLFCKV